MDDKWFKSKQKLAGVTAEDIAKIIGRDRSVVSHIYNRRQKMSPEWAQAFAQALEVPIEEVYERAGILPKDLAPRIAPGFSDSDAAAWVGKPGATQKVDQMAAAMGGGKPGIDVWQVKSDSLSLMGYLPNDFILVDMRKPDRAKPGDVVIAQHYNGQTGTAATLLRRFEPPVLVAATTKGEDHRVHVVDGNNVVIRGVVTALWREPN
ncbi:MAG: helix-turn-helix transcriptional regulator [Pseudomonadota bacterium]